MKKYPEIKNNSLFAYTLVLLKRLPDESSKKSLIQTVENVIDEYRNDIDYGFVLCFFLCRNVLQMLHIYLGCEYLDGKLIRKDAVKVLQMAVDDDILVKNPFGFQLAGVLVNDAVTSEAISKDQMRKVLKFVHDDVVYCKYYEVVYIFFHAGMRILEFCGLTLKDIDLEKRTVNIDHQLQRTSDMRYIIETTKTDAGTRVLPITEDVAEMFQAIIEDRNAPKVEKAIDGYSGFLFYDDNGMPLVAMHWQHRFNHMVGRYNDIYRVQMPNITPHVCRHTYCSNMAKPGMNPKTLQYLMGIRIYRSP